MVMKILNAVPRFLLGAALLGSGVMGLIKGLPAQEVSGQAALYLNALSGTYLLTLVKLTEVVAGLLLLSNRFVALALILAAPVVVNIFFFHAFYAQEGIPVGVVLVALEAFVALKHRAVYAPLFVATLPAREVAPSARAVVS